MDSSLVVASAGRTPAARGDTPQRPVAPPPAQRAPGARVEVLLSTYNGEKYLPELLQSLLDQSHRSIHLRVRDDGSTDGTLDILNEYVRGHPASLHTDVHLGVPASFFRLLHDADPEADFYGFCDQDDVWLPHKVEAAVDVLQRGDPSVPALYCSALMPVDFQLRPLPNPWAPPLALGFRNALVENRASGCTAMFNRAARDLLTRCTPRAAQMHDHWVYLVVSAFGTVHYDPRPSMLYRQHESNRVGIPNGWRSKLRSPRRRGGSPMYSQAEEFRAVYGDALEPAFRAVLDRFLATRRGMARRVGYALRPETYRQTIADDLAHRVLIGLGLF
jgi:glycosyltransferase involved in cell wall biosynthesis